MKLYEITNGYIGDSYVRCLVIAESKEQAIQAARPKFAADDPRPGYSELLQAMCLCEDVTREWVGEVSD